MTTTSMESDAFARYRESRPGPRSGALGPNLILAVLAIAVCAVWWLAAPRLMVGKTTTFTPRGTDKFPDGVLTIVQLDVGQGDATFIHTPGGMNVLIDCGEGANPENDHSRQYPAAKFVVQPFLEMHGIFELDMLILTHPDSDHGGGMADLIDWLYANGGNVKLFVTSGVSKPAVFFDNLLKAVDRHQIKFRSVLEPGSDAPQPLEYEEYGGTLIGKDLLKDPTIAFQILGPVTRIGDAEGEIANENSVVTRIQCGKISMLSAGDAEVEEEESLVAFWGPRLRSTINFAAHHGSKTSDQPNWLRMVNPEYLSSSSHPPVFGHPAADAVKSWKTYIDPPVKYFLRTDMNGDIWYRTDGNKLSIRTQFPVKSEAEQWEPGHAKEWREYREFKPNDPTTWGDCIPVPGTDEL